MAAIKKISDYPVFRAFRSVNYTLYFFGRAVSQFGTWMQRTAVIWVIYSITHSAFLLGVTVFAEQIPSLIFSVFGGIASDRYDRYKVIKITQITSMIQAILLAALVITGHTIVWAILALSVILGIINAFDIPARQALVHDVVTSPEDLPNAFSLTTATASLAQLAGPALAGVVLNLFGAGVCFLLNAASFAGVLISLLLMKLPAHQPKNSEKNALKELTEGFSYLKNTPELGIIVLLLAIVSLFVLPYNTVIPIFAKVIFKGNASTFGYITSFIGVGAVTGTIFLASRKPGAPLKRILLISTIMMGFGLIAFSRITSFPVAMVFAVIIGFGAIAQYTVSSIIIQSGSDPEMRGRVISIFLMAIFGMVPIGSVLIGAVSERIGAPNTVLCEGVISLIIALAFARFLMRKQAIPATKK
jgi:MFS family permease